MLGDLIVAADPRRPSTTGTRPSGSRPTLRLGADRRRCARGRGGPADQRADRRRPGLIAVGQQTADGTKTPRCGSRPTDALESGRGSRRRARGRITAVVAVASSDGLIVAAGPRPWSGEERRRLALERRHVVVPSIANRAGHVHPVRLRPAGIRELFVVDGVVVALGWRARTTMTPTLGSVTWPADATPTARLVADASRRPQASRRRRDRALVSRLVDGAEPAGALLEVADRLVQVLAVEVGQSTA